VYLPALHLVAASSYWASEIRISRLFSKRSFHRK